MLFKENSRGTEINYFKHQEGAIVNIYSLTYLGYSIKIKSQNRWQCDWEHVVYLEYNHFPFTFSVKLDLSLFLMSNSFQYKS